MKLGLGQYILALSMTLGAMQAPPTPPVDELAKRQQQFTADKAKLARDKNEYESKKKELEKFKKQLEMKEEELNLQDKRIKLMIKQKSAK